MYLDQVIAAMETVFRELPWAIDHTRQVLRLVESLMSGEGVDPADRERIAITAVLHDIGLPAAQHTHGSMAAPYQEQEGAVLARQLLQAIGYDPQATERVSFIVGHHHTPEAIDGLDFRLLWEADFLVNVEQMPLRHDPAQLQAAIAANITTNTGRLLARHRLGV